MKRRFRVHQKNGPPPVGKVFILTVIVFLISVFGSLELIERGIRPTLMEIAEQRTMQVARWAINEAVNKEMASDLDPSNLVVEKFDNEGNLETVGWNSVIINTFLRNATYRVQNYLKRIENGGVTPENALDLNAEINNPNPDLESIGEHPSFTEIPLGEALNNSLLANLGPRIPVHFKIMGAVESNTKVEFESVGINGGWVYHFIEFKVTVQIVVPFTTEKTELTQRVLMDSRFFTGEVPDFYTEGGSGKGPDVTVPFDSVE